MQSCSEGRNHRKDWSYSERQWILYRNICTGNAGKGKGTMRTDSALNARQRLAKDARDLRKLFGTKCNKAIRKAIDYAKTLPDFQK